MQTAPRLDQRGGLFGIGRQVQVGVQDLPRAQHLAFLRLRLLDLDHHLGAVEDLGRRGEQLGPGLPVLLVRQPDGCASAGLHGDRVAMQGQLSHAGRRQADAVLMVLDFLGYTDAHAGLLLRSPHFSANRVRHKHRSRNFTVH
jgi:hypothetical protein